MEAATDKVLFCQKAEVWHFVQNSIKRKNLEQITHIFDQINAWEIFICTLYTVLYLYTAKRRDVLGFTSPTTKRFPEAREMSRG